MSAERRDRLLLLAAELADERARVARLLSESEHAARRLGDPATETLVAYGVVQTIQGWIRGLEEG